MLESGGQSPAGGVILLVTSGSPLPLTPYDVEQMGAIVTQRGVRVVPIVYPVTDRNPKPTPGVEKLAMLSGRSIKLFKRSRQVTLDWTDPHCALFSRSFLLF